MWRDQSTFWSPAQGLGEVAEQPAALKTVRVRIKFTDFFKIKLWQWCCVEPTGNTFCLCHTTRFLKLSDHCAFHTTYTCCTVWLIRDKGSHTWPLAWDVTNCALSFSENTKENNIGEMMDYGTQAARIISGLKMWNGLLALHDGLGHIGKRDKGGGELLLLAVAHF